MTAFQIGALVGGLFGMWAAIQRNAALNGGRFSFAGAHLLAVAVTTALFGLMCGLIGHFIGWLTR